MTATFNVSANTQSLVQKAVNQGPGVNNQNYIAAYNAISADIQANGGVNAGTAYWFSQAGAVNGQGSSPTAAGTYIWAYTQAAAATQGYTVSPQDLQSASNAIASTVFKQLADNNYVFSDDTNAPSNFSPEKIVANDAGAGIGYLKSLYPNIDYADWGGTLFAQTVLQDSTYVSDYHLHLTPNSSDCNAILAGNQAGIGAELAAFVSRPLETIGATLGSIGSIDTSITGACLSNLNPMLIPPGGFGYNTNGQVTGGQFADNAGNLDTAAYTYGANGSLSQATYVTPAATSTGMGLSVTATEKSSGAPSSLDVSTTSSSGARLSDTTVNLGNGTGNNSLSTGLSGGMASLSGGDGTAVTVDGSAAMIRLGNNANLTDNTSGSTDTTGGNSQVNINGNGTLLTNNGSGCTDGIHCVGDQVDTTGSTVNVNSTDSTVVVSGDGNTITGTNGSQITLENTGPSGDGVTGDGLNVVADQGVSANVSGTGVTVTETGSGTNVGVFNDGTSADTVIENGNNEFTNVQTNAADPTGGSVSVTANGASDYAGLLGGSGYTVTLSNGTLNTWDNTNFTLNGSSDAVGVDVYPDGSITTGSSGSITGTNDTLTVNGSGDIFNIQNTGGATDTVNINGANGDYAGLLGGADVGGNYQVNDNASSSTVNTWDDTDFTLVGSNVQPGQTAAVRWTPFRSHASARSMPTSSRWPMTRSPAMRRAA